METGGALALGLGCPWGAKEGSPQGGQRAPTLSGRWGGTGGVKEGR